MCTLFENLLVINVGSPYGLHGVHIWFTWGPHMVYMGSPYDLHGVPIYILYVYDHMWLVGQDRVALHVTVTKIR